MTTDDPTGTITSGAIDANGLRFAYLESGPADGPLALCLHGFPDSAWGWRHLLPELGAAGYRAVAPFLRGYAPTGIPADGRYQLGALAEDANALHDALGGDEQAVILGHDWGAMATYGAAALAPRKWRRVVTAAVPPAGAMATAFFETAQLKRSWYIFFFQHPLSDLVVPMSDLAFIDRLWDDWSPSYRGDAQAEDLAHVKDCLRDPANLLAAMSYYRHMMNPEYQVPELADAQAASGLPTPQPLLYLHGIEDGCMGVDLAANAAAFGGPGSEVAIVEGAGHFLLQEQPAIVNERILAFLARA